MGRLRESFTDLFDRSFEYPGVGIHNQKLGAFVVGLVPLVLAVWQFVENGLAAVEPLVWLAGPVFAFLGGLLGLDVEIETLYYWWAWSDGTAPPSRVERPEEHDRPTGERPHYEWRHGDATDDRHTERE